MIECLTLILLAGAVLYHSVGIGLGGIVIISALMSAFFFIYFLTTKALLFGLLCGTIFLFGAITVWMNTTTVPTDFYADRTVQGIVENVDRRLDKTILVVKDQQYEQLFQVTIHSSDSFLPGDKVAVCGTIQQPQDFMTDTGRLFEYQAYLQSKNIIGIIPNGTITLLQKGNDSLNRFATILRFDIADTLTTYVQFPIDGLLAGIVVGYQGGVPQSIQDLFRTTGILHILVLSGENITLLAVFLAIVLKPVPFRLRSFLTVCSILLVVLISGSGVSAVRAGIMGVIALLAAIVKRSYMPFRALTLSILFFFFYSPQTIFADPGFHLSVLATIFMIIVLPKIESLFQWLPEKYSIRELVIVGICVPLFMLPYTMYFSGLVPAASPFANILMAIMTPFLMLSGALILGFSWLQPFVQLLGLVVSWIGDSVLKSLTILNMLPQLNTLPIAWWGVLAWYTVFFIIVFRFEIRQFWNDLKNSFLPLTSSSEIENQ